MGTWEVPGELSAYAKLDRPPGCSIDNASFVPIDAAKLTDAMSHWEKYNHTETQDHLELAILHAEFEALPPFLDGNGRLGRFQSDDWTGWCVFFLNAVKAQAEDNQNRATAILRLYDEIKIRVFALCCNCLP